MIRPTSLALLFATSTALSGCMGTGTSASLATSRAALNTAQSGPQILESDLTRSCAELTSMAAALYARHEQIVKTANATQARNSMIGGLLSTGIAVVGGNAMVNAGGIGAMRGAAAATSLSQTALSAALMNAHPTSLKDVTDVSLIANRAAQIERVRLQKGCASA